MKLFSFRFHGIAGGETHNALESVLRQHAPTERFARGFVREENGMWNSRFRLLARAMACAVPLAMCLASSPAWSDHHEEEKEAKEHAVARDVLKAAKIDLLQAVETAQAKVEGAAPFKAIAEEENEKHVFEVYFLKGEKVTEVEVNAESGDVVKTEDETGEYDEEALANVRQAIEASKTTFREAITVAQQPVEGGRPFEVELELQDGKAVMEVELLADEKIMSVEIDAARGDVLEVEQEAELEEHEHKEEEEEEREERER